MRMNQDERRFDFHGLGLALKRAREEKGWTQAYVAELVDRDSRTIMNIENKGHYPSFDLFVKLITMFDISVDQFILFFCAILGAVAKWQAMPLWPQVAQRRLVGARPKPVSSGQHGPKCQRRFAPYFHNLNAPFPAFFPARCSPSKCQCSP